MAPPTQRPRKTASELRSLRWFGPDDVRSFIHRSRMKQMGYVSDDYSGKPIIALLNTWSEFTSCHVHLRQRAEEIKRGVWQAGGFPLEVPVVSLSETYMKPSTLLYRNLLAMETEEVLRAHPVDGVVLMGGCDKTTPALIMGATSANLPAIYFCAGPMLRGNWRGRPLGSGADVWKYWTERRAGNLCDEDLGEIEDGIARSPGHCMTMGTASTMTALAETLGLCLPGSSTVPAMDSAHSRVADLTGRRIVEMVWEDLKPSDLLTDPAFEDAITVDMAIGGSTNAIIHLVAMAARAGIPLPLERFDLGSRRTPVLANLRPSGQYLMEDFYFAGGLRGLLWRIRDRLHLGRTTVTGKTLGEDLEGAQIYNEDVIRPVDRALAQEGGTFILRGNLAPEGAVLKVTAADPRLLRHRGPALVFGDVEDLARRIDAPDLPVTADSVLVLRNAGPVGGPGMPEWGMLPIPRKLLDQGVRDIVRLSDARMSGTSYGTCILHVDPEAAVGGPIALVRDGDPIELDAPARRLHLDVSEAELARRRAAWAPPAPKYHRGFGKLFLTHVTQAHQGCDFDFLARGGPTPDPHIY